MWSVPRLLNVATTKKIGKPKGLIGDEYGLAFNFRDAAYSGVARHQLEIARIARSKAQEQPN